MAENDEKSIDSIELIQKYEEHNQFLRWLKNRGVEADLTQFKALYMLDGEKQKAYDTWIQGLEDEKMIEEFADTMRKLNV